MSFFFNRDNMRNHPHMRDANFRLTQDGRTKLQEFNGNPQSQVLMALEVMQGSGSVEDIARQSGLSRGRLERLLPIMVKHGLVQAQVGAHGEVDDAT